MRGRPKENAAPRRALVEPIPPSEPQLLESAWKPLLLDTPVELLRWANLIAMQGDEYVVAYIHPVVHGTLRLNLAPVHTWRNGGEWPRHRDRDVPGFTTVESVALAHGLAPTRAFHLPELSWRKVRPPRVIVGNTTIRLEDALVRLPRDVGPRAAAEDRVAEIRTLYGRMLTDIAYRIENSALFDSSVPTTRQFETALALFSDVTPGTSNEEIARRSAVVAVAFRTARAHAETVGLGHLPVTALDSARRAAGAARLARTSTSESERAAAQLRVATILRTLALECLPDPATLPRAIASGPAADPLARP
ncbi:MAG: hypothetical protein ACTHWA_12290 [Arachnia sp.]